MKNIYITGATSFIGVNLIKELLNKGYNVIAIIRNKSKNKDLLNGFKNIKIIELDMEEMEKLPSLTDIRCDIFYHLAWNGTRGEARDNKKIQEDNYFNSIKVLKVAKKMGCKTFFSAGSQAEYGLHDCIVTEETIEKPVTEYGKNKLKFCNYAMDYCKNNNMVFIEPRFFSLYGVGDNENTLIINAIDKMLRNEIINLTACIQKWNYLNIKDAVDALIKLQDVNKSGIYNFGSTDTRLLKDFIDEMYNITKSKSVINYGIIPYSKAGIVNVNPCIDKLVNEINWVPKIKFCDGIKEIVEKR